VRLQRGVAIEPGEKRICVEDYCHSAGSTVSNSFSMTFSIRRFSFRNFESAPKCFIHGFLPDTCTCSFSFIASATKSRSVRPPGGGGKVPINPGYILYHDNEKIVIRNYEGKIFEYPESGNENVQFAPQREYHDEYLYS
jgi:hypothetical protein